MTKRILFACLVAILGVWISLTLLGKDTLPGAPIHQAWIVPLGPGGWEYVVKGIGNEGMTKDALTDILGNPNDVSTSAAHAGQEYLHYTNPHDRGRYVPFAVSKDNVILRATPGKSMPQKL